MARRTIQTQDKFMIRLPDGMRDRIAEAAKANNRTMTAEIVSRLEASFGIAAPRSVEARVADLEKQFADFLKLIQEPSDD